MRRPAAGPSRASITAALHDAITMSDHPDPPNRAYHQPDPGQVTVREDDDDEDGTFAVRMPIASTGVVRNEGDEPLSRDEIDGMAAQINEGDVGVFLSHGQSFEITDARYGQTERLGTWRDAAVESPDGDERAADESDLLMATATMADPETLPEETGRFREALAVIKEQAKRDIPLSASIGWREDEDSPGGNDLMEASIVGIPADPRTVTQGGPAAAVARAAIEAGAEPEALVEAVRAAVMEPEADAERDMTDDEDTEPDAENEASDTDDEEQTERDETPEWVSTMLENQQAIADGINGIADQLRPDDDDEDDDDEDDEDQADDDEDEDDDEENAADEPDEEQAADEVETLRDHLDALREGGIDVTDVDLPEPDPDADEARDADETGDTDPNEDAAKALLR